MTMTLPTPSAGLAAAASTRVEMASKVSANAANAASAANATGAASTTSAAAAASAGVPAAASAGRFGPLMNADDTRGDVAAASPADQDGAPDEAVDVLDAALAQALEDLLGGNLAHTASAAGDAVLGVVVGGKKDEDTGSSDATAGTVPPTTTAPLMAMLMPTLMPAVMPPAPAARGLVSTDDATPTATRPLPDVPSALTADPARLLALQGTDGATPALGQPAPAGSADTANAANAANTAAWQGLQRWSADLMSAMATTPAPGAAANDAGGATLSLPAARDAWSQPLMQALGDRLQLQIAQRADSARLHLEPPQLGRIEIDIRQQGGALQVQLSASHDEVRQQLRQIAEPLRHELVQRHAGEVSVQVASGAQAAGDGRGRDGAAGGQPQSQGQPREQRQPGRALDDDHANTAGATNVAAFADAFQAHAGTTAASGAAGAIGAIGALGGHAAPLKRTSR